MEMLSMFDMLPDEEAKKYKPIESTDWKWTMTNDYPKEKNGLKVFSCFACGGGSTMGYKLAGCEVIGCCEIDPKMNEVYVKNHHPKHNFVMDIRKFNELPNDELPAELFDLDSLDGSPPCTTFSIAGEREESWGKKKKFREGQAEQTLDDLSFVFIKSVAKLKPRCVIMENVEGLLLGEAWSYVQEIYRQFGEIGYHVKHWLCKGENMGVPQTRHRVIFIALRNDVEYDLADLDMSFNYKPVCYGEIKSGVGENLNPNTVIYQWLQRAQPGDKRISDTIVRCGEKEKLFNHRICWPENIMQTIAGAGEILRGEEKTRVSVEDIIHGQTFPEDYVFSERTFKSAAYICGMSVPPIMIKRVVTRLIESGVFEYEKRKKTNSRTAAGA
jgi:DNA (cytosine-5)-methyltransferase 1